MIDVQLEAIGYNGLILLKSTGCAATASRARYEAWNGMSALLAEAPEVERQVRDMRIVRGE